LPLCRFAPNRFATVDLMNFSCSICSRLGAQVGLAANLNWSVDREVLTNPAAQGPRPDPPRPAIPSADSANHETSSPAVESAATEINVSSPLPYRVHRTCSLTRALSEPCRPGPLPCSARLPRPDRRRSELQVLPPRWSASRLSPQRRRFPLPA